jgi:predicted O-linked N-acetylglucosamine transferase (SPINDLY family)
VLEDIGQIGAAVSEWMKLVGKLSAVTGDTVAHKLTVLHQAAAFWKAITTTARRRCAQAEPRHQSPSGRGHAALDFASSAAMQMAGGSRMGARQAQGLLNGISTLSLANLADDPMFQLAKAYRYARQSIGMPKAVRSSSGAAGRADPQRLRSATSRRTSATTRSGLP